MKVIAWSSRQRRFVANLQALAQHHPHIAALLEQIDVSSFLLYQTPEGEFALTAPPRTAPALLQPAMSNPLALQSVWSFDKRETPAPAPIIFDGCSHGLFLQHVATTTARSFLGYSCALYLLEPDPLALAIALRIADLRELLMSGRLRVFTGEGAERDFEAALLAHDDWSLPVPIIHNPLLPRPALQLDPLLERVVKARQTQRTELKQRVDAHYAGISIEQWRKKFAAGRPLTVLGITSRFTTVLQFSMAELAAAARAAGHTFHLAIENDDYTNEHPALRMIDTLKPDLVVQLSRMRYENPAMPRGVPHLCWDQDNLPCMRTPQATASIDRLTFVAGHGAFHGYVYLGWPERQCIFCQPAGAAHRYGGEVQPDDLARYACDLSYVSNASGAAEALAANLARRYQKNPDADGVFAKLTQAVFAAGGAGEPWSGTRLSRRCIEIERAADVTLADTLRDELVMDAVTVADRVFRHAVLRWAADFCDETGRTLKLYGAGWSDHPRFAKYAAGSAAPGDEMRLIYRASKINLQIIETGFMHSRALDGLCAGGFFLTRRTPYDGLVPGEAEAHHRVARYVRMHNIAALAALDGDPAIRSDWQRIRPLLVHEDDGALHREQEVIRGLRALADMPAASVVLPHFDDIAFVDEQSFRARADRFLADDAERQRISAAMHAAALEHFSYDARWRHFITHIQQTLAAEVQP